MPSAGPLLCLASAAAFGAMGIFGKLAYEQGATTGTVLSARFVIAAAVLWLVVACSGRLRDLRAVSRGDLAKAFALGAVGYSSQAGCYFAGLQRIDASLLALLVYTFPTMVTVTAIAIGRERASRRIVVALAIASTGLVLVLAGAVDGASDPLGISLGLTAAIIYTVYILTSEGIAGRVGPLVLSTLICTGAAASLTLGAAGLDDLHPAAVSLTGVSWLAGIALVSTVGAIGLFFAGLHRVGPSAASILSTLEPVVTVALVFVVFGEALGPVPLLGGALVLLAVLAVRIPARVASPAGA